MAENGIKFCFVSMAPVLDVNFPQQGCEADTGRAEGNTWSQRSPNLHLDAVPNAHPSCTGRTAQPNAPHGFR